MTEATNLHVLPWRKQVADGDRTAFVFSAGENISSATATLENAATGVSASSLIVSTAVDTTADTVTVTVAGLTRDVDYLLAVTFVRADGTKWTRLLTIQCIV